MSARICPTMLRMRGFFWPLPIISSAPTMGTPDFIIVAICRLKNEMSLADTFFPAAPNNGFGFTFTIVGVMPCLRSSARSMFAFFAVCSPFIFTPRLSVPSHTNGLPCSNFEIGFVLTAPRTAAI
ncbi:hypothetical protein XAB3213_4590005 [Xanthomonas citri pv. bilvae]|nr:hypothetical protein XAB3213_4590005 [Xanthomonas citri pv. bilvae]